VAFVGAAGSGKSTLANLLGRFYDPGAGSISIDGIDLREVEIASLRKLIGIVTQDTILFHDTVANNIAYGSPDATPEEIREAARLADAAGFIEAAEGGYDKIGGDKGFQFSGGQKQRISIARNILRNPQILILDEATSALDSATELQVHQQLQQLMENRTVFAIAHRLSTVRDADCIYVLHEGKIVEAGTHAELIALEGRYRMLHDLQFGSTSSEVAAQPQA
jgi:ATP-binding cassette, subfamily B, bacterial MsbA